MSRCRWPTLFLAWISPVSPTTLTLYLLKQLSSLPTSHPSTDPTSDTSEMHRQSNHFPPPLLLCPWATLPFPPLGVGSPISLLPHLLPCSFFFVHKPEESFWNTSKLHSSPPQPRRPSQITHTEPRALTVGRPYRPWPLTHVLQRLDLTMHHPLPEGSAHPIPSAGDDPPVHSKAGFSLFQRDQHSPSTTLPSSHACIFSEGLAPADTRYLSPYSLMFPWRSECVTSAGLGSLLQPQHLTGLPHSGHAGSFLMK